MPPLTRAASRLLEARAVVACDKSPSSRDSSPTLPTPPTPPPTPVPTPAITWESLRLPVTSKRDAVWAFHDDVDAYTGSRRTDVVRPNVDHCLEIQLAELSLARSVPLSTFATGVTTATRTRALASDVSEVLRVALNETHNLNVTSASVNQSKRGPFTAAIRRLQPDCRLRVVPVEQLARQGRARRLVDDGTWHRIERAVVRSFDSVTARATTLAEAYDEGQVAECVEEVGEDLQRLLSSIGLE